jgi:hypothetical protein
MTPWGQQVNAALPDIITHWDNWREEALRRLMHEFDDIIESAAATVDDPVEPIVLN